jgi:peptidoglycan-associated lipoprotein
MTRPIHLLLLAGAISALLGGCATRAKAPPTSGPPDAVQPQGHGADPPPARDAPPDSVATLSAQEQLAATAGDRVYFALDSDKLDGEARAILQRQAAWLRANPGIRARIEGNADERGTREYNFALGARRSAAARQALISAGVAATRLETVSYGKERPLDPGPDEAAWAKNRNAGTVVIGIGPP